MLEGGLYKLLVNTTKDDTLVHDSGNLCKLWYKHFGHLNHGALPLLMDMVYGLPNFKVEKIEECIGCALNEHSKIAFPSSEEKSRNILKLMQSDVCGPMPSSSFIDKLYYVSFIDDSSHKTKIYFMKTKYEVSGKFKEFKALVENQMGKRSKCFNFRGENTSKDFDTFCKETRIKRVLRMGL